jgi:hypothetical protein
MSIFQRYDLPPGQGCVYAAHRKGLTAIFAIANHLTKKRIVLASIRHINDNIAGTERTLKYLAIAMMQAHNLNRKLYCLDLLELNDLRITQLFTAGRMIVISNDKILEQSAWKFAENCVEIFSKETTMRIATQPDYDQMYAQCFMSESISMMDLKTKHDPSAIGTVAAFQVILGEFLGKRMPASWGLLGVGNLGSRIIKNIISCSGTVFAFDQDQTKLKAFKNMSHLQLCSYKEWVNASPQAIVFAGHSGSLTEKMAKDLMKNKRLIVFGGPEAGLDGQRQIVDTFTRKGIHFMPSLLCGAMGLVSNLSEIVKKPPLVTQQERTLVSHVKKILIMALKEGNTFQDCFEGYILNRLWKGQTNSTVDLLQTE